MIKETKPSDSLTQLLINIIIPTFILIKGSDTSFLSSVQAFSLAVSIPLIYGLVEYIKFKKRNLFSIIGLINITLTGAIGLLELDPKWLAIKEAGVPFFLGIALIIAIRLKVPILDSLLEFALDMERIQSELKTPAKKEHFKKKVTLTTYLIAVSFFLSSLLNYILAKWLVQSSPGTVEFNQELGRLTALSFPVIALPSTLFLVAAIWMLIRHIQKTTSLKLDEIINQPD